MRVSQKTLSENDKDVIGRKCCNCGSEKDMQYHHIVPLHLGGSNEISNYCCLCYNCHSLVHYGFKAKISNHSEATKIGIQTARLNGKQIGQKPGAKLKVKKAAPAKEQIRKYNKDFGGMLSNEETWRLIGISKMTFYKYKREIKNSINQKEQS